MAREQDFGRLYCETLAIPAGSTATFSTIPGMYGFVVQYISGGSLSIGGPSFNLGTSYINGSSFQLGGYGSTAGTIFTLNSANVFSVSEFIGSFNLIATGATSVVSLARVFTVGAQSAGNVFLP